MQLKYSDIGDEPITLVAAKAYLKVDYSDEDAMITYLITGIREQIEQFTGRALVVKTIEYFNEEIPDQIKLPFPSHDAIVEVQINGEVSTAYTKTGLDRIIVTPTYAYASQDSDSGIYIKYTTLGTCPEAIRLEMLKLLDEKYRNRGNTFEGSIADLSENTYANLAKYCQM